MFVGLYLVSIPAPGSQASEITSKLTTSDRCKGHDDRIIRRRHYG